MILCHEFRAYENEFPKNKRFFSSKHPYLQKQLSFSQKSLRLQRYLSICETYFVEKPRILALAKMQRLGNALFPQSSKWQVAWIYRKIMASSQNPFPHIFQKGLKFWEKWEKQVKNQHSAPLFDRRCTFGDTLGESMFEGLTMGQFHKFKMF